MNNTIKKLFTNTDEMCTVVNIVSLIWSVITVFLAGTLFGSYICDEISTTFNKNRKLERLKMKKMTIDHYDLLSSMKNDEDLKVFLKGNNKDESDVYLLRSILNELERERY